MIPDSEQIIQSIKASLFDFIKTYRNYSLGFIYVIALISLSILIFGGKDNISLLSSFFAAISCLITFLSMFAIIHIFSFEQAERAKERELNNDLMVLVNFILHYISIEDDLLFGSYIKTEAGEFTIFPIGVKRIFEGTPVTKDNVFAHLNIFYAIVDMVKSKGDAALRKEKYLANDPVAKIRFTDSGMKCIHLNNKTHSSIGYNADEIESWTVDTNCCLNIESNWQLVDSAENTEADTQMNKETYICFCNKKGITHYALKANYCDEIEGRIYPKLFDIFERDNKCRKHIGYALAECKFLENERKTDSVAP